MKKIVSGVYRISNIVNGKVYIGSSVNVKQRLYNHKRELSKNIHCNSYLQNSWNKYGEQNFIFNMIEEVAVLFKKPEREQKLLLLPNLLRLEQIYLDNYHSCERKNGYNLSPTSGSCLGIKLDQSSASILKMKKRIKKRFRCFEERRVEIFKKAIEELPKEFSYIQLKNKLNKDMKKFFEKRKIFEMLQKLNIKTLCDTCDKPNGSFFVRFCNEECEKTYNRTVKMNKSIEVIKSTLEALPLTFCFSDFYKKMKEIKNGGMHVHRIRKVFNILGVNNVFICEHCGKLHNKFSRFCCPLCKLTSAGVIRWNKGLTKETNEGVRRSCPGNWEKYKRDRISILKKALLELPSEFTFSTINSFIIYNLKAKISRKHILETLELLGKKITKGKPILIHD